jgi:hypothetical protein
MDSFSLLKPCRMDFFWERYEINFPYSLIFIMKFQNFHDAPRGLAQNHRLRRERPAVTKAPRRP